MRPSWHEEEYIDTNPRAHSVCACVRVRACVGACVRVPPSLQHSPTTPFSSLFGIVSLKVGREG